MQTISMLIGLFVQPTLFSNHVEHVSPILCVYTSIKGKTNFQLKYSRMNGHWKHCFNVKKLSGLYHQRFSNVWKKNFFWEKRPYFVSICLSMNWIENNKIKGEFNWVLMGFFDHFLSTDSTFGVINGVYEI